MFKKLGRVLGGGAKGSVKYKVEVQVVSVERLPTSVKKCRVVWVGKSSAKLQMTGLQDVQRAGVAQFNKQTLTQVANLHKDKNGDFEPKEYSIKVQAPQGTGSSEALATIGKGSIDLANFVDDTGHTQAETLPITFKVGSATLGYVKLVITTTPLGEMSEDGMTEVSGMTGLTSETGAVDQDLEGFDDNSPSAKASKRERSSASDSAGGFGRRTGSSHGGARRGGSSLPATKEEDPGGGSDEEGQDSGLTRGGSRRSPLGVGARAGGAADPFSKKSSPAKKTPAKSRWDDDDDDVSPVGSDLSDEEDARPPPKKAEPKAAAAAAAKPKEPEPELGDLKASLFGKKKATEPAAPGGKTGAGGSKASGKAAAALVPEIEEDTRAALFAAPSKAAGRAGGAAGSSKAPAAAPPPDEDEVRAALFTTVKKPSAAPGAAAKGGRLLGGDSQPASKGIAAAAPSAPPQDDIDEDAARSALFSAPAKPRSGSGAAKPPKAPTSAFGDDAFGDQPAFPAGPAAAQDFGRKASGSTPASSSKAKPPLGRPPVAAASTDGEEDQEEDELGVAVKPSGSKGGSGRLAAPPAAAGRGGAAAGAAAAADGAELRKVQAENQALQARVAALQASEAQLAQQLAQVQDRCQQLEAKLAESAGMAAQQEAARLRDQLAYAATTWGIPPPPASLAQGPQEQFAGLLGHLQQHYYAAAQQLQAASAAHETARSRWEQDAAQLQQTINQLTQERGQLQGELEKRGAEHQQLQQHVASLTDKLAVATAAAAAAAAAAVGPTPSPLTKRSSSSASQLQAAAGEAGPGASSDDNARHAPGSSSSSSLLPPRSSSAALAVATGAGDDPLQLQRLLRDNQAATEQLQELEYQLKQARRSAEINQAGLAAELDRVVAELAAAAAESARLVERVEALQLENQALKATAASQQQQLKPTAAGQQEGRLGERSSRTSDRALSGRLSTERLSTERLFASSSSGRLRTDQPPGASSSSSSGRLRAPLRGPSGGQVEDLGGSSAAAAAALQAQLDALRGEHVALQGQVEALEGEKRELQARLEEFSEAEAIIKEWSEYAEGLVAERDALVVERDKLAAEGQRLSGQPDASLASERDSLAAERDALLAERDKLAAAHDALLAERDALVTERDALVVARDALASQWSSLASERDQLVSERDALQAQLDQAGARQQGQAVVPAHVVETTSQLSHSMSLELEALAGKAVVMDAANVTLKQEADALRARMAQLVGEGTALRQEVVQLRAQVVELQSQATHAAHADQALVTLQAAHTALQRAHVDAQRAAEQAEVHSTQLQVQVSSRDEALQQLKAHVSQLSRELEACRKELEASQREPSVVSGLIPTQPTISHRSTPIRPPGPAGIPQSLGAPSDATPLTLTAGSWGDSSSNGAPSSTDGHEFEATLSQPPLRGASGGHPVLQAGAAAAVVPPVLQQAVQEQQGELGGELGAGTAQRVSTSGGSSAQFETEAGRLNAQLWTAASTVHAARRVLAGCMGVVSSREAGLVSEDITLDVALMCLKDESVALLHELRRQAQDAPRFEAQLSSATQRVVELEAQVHELQEENHMLAGLQPGLLAGLPQACHTALPPGALPSQGRGMQGPVYGASAPSLAQGASGWPGGQSAAGGEAGQPFLTAAAGFKQLVRNPLYGDDAALAVSAMEQQLALTEAQMQDVQSSVEVLQRENVQLRKEVEQLRMGNHVQPAQSAEPPSSGMEAQPALQQAKTPSKTSRRFAGGSSDEEDEPALNARGALAARKAGKAAGKVPPEVQRELEQLRDKCAQLESACTELEQRGGAERARLQQQLDAARADVQAAQDALQQAQARWQADSKQTAGSADDVRALRSQVSELERRVAGLMRENVSLAEQLEEEQGLREELERQVKRGLDDLGEEEVLETVEAFEAKYARLRERHKRAEAAAAQQLEELEGELQAAQQQVVELQQQQEGGARGGVAARGAGGPAAAAAAAAAAGKEVQELRRENEALLGQLVAKQVEAAELAEQQAMLRRDLYRLKEVNMKLASKMTRLEAQALSQVHEKKRLFGGSASRKKQVASLHSSQDGTEQLGYL